MNLNKDIESYKVGQRHQVLGVNVTPLLHIFLNDGGINFNEDVKPYKRMVGKLQR